MIIEVMNQHSYEDLSPSAGPFARIGATINLVKVIANKHILQNAK